MQFYSRSKLARNLFLASAIAFSSFFLDGHSGDNNKNAVRQMKPMQVFAENPGAAQNNQGQASQLYLAQLQSDPKRVIKATYREYSSGERMEIESINAEYLLKRLALSESMKQELEGKFRITLSRPYNITEIFRQCALTLCDLLDRYATDHGRNGLGLFYQDSLVSSNISKTYGLIGGKGLPYGVQKAYIEKFVSLEIERQNDIQNIGASGAVQINNAAMEKRLALAAKMKAQFGLSGTAEDIAEAFRKVSEFDADFLRKIRRQEEKKGRGESFEFDYQKYPKLFGRIKNAFESFGGQSTSEDVMCEYENQFVLIELKRRFSLASEEIDGKLSKQLRILKNSK